MANIGVLGGGISGLTFAWWLKRLNPAASVTLIEKSNRLGGWIDSRWTNSTPLTNTFLMNQHIDTTDLPPFLFESGPRTLRPGGVNGLATLEMIYALGLHEKPNTLLTVSKDSTSAKNRFIFLDNTLYNLRPSLTLLKNRKLRNVLIGALKEPFISRSTSIMTGHDESIASFVGRRFGQPMVDHLLSAVIHGIYAGDVNNLSIRATLPFLWNAEKESGSVLRHLFKSSIASLDPATKAPSFESLVQEQLASSSVLPNHSLSDFTQFAKQMNSGCSIYTFSDGLESVVHELLLDLEKSGVHILYDTECTEIHNRMGSIEVVSSSKGQVWKGDHIVSGLPSYQLSRILSSSHDGCQSRVTSILDQTPFVDVAVVNLAFHSSQLPVDGFGFLVPASELKASGGVLGVIFDSCVHKNAMRKEKMSDTVNVTVMMGGYVFRDHFGAPSNVSTSKLLNLALKTVSNPSGLGLDPSKLVHSRVAVHQKCIPSYTTDHLNHLKRLHTALTEYGRLTVIGNSFTGVGINDCVSSAKRAAVRIAAAKSSAHIQCTGLEEFS